MPDRPPKCADGTCGLCFPCHVRSINISPAALPTRRNNLPPKPPQYNSYENGEPRDSRGMPYLGPDLKPVSQKSFDASRRKREDAVRNPQSVKDTRT